VCVQCSVVYEYMSSFAFTHVHTHTPTLTHTLTPVDQRDIMGRRESRRHRHDKYDTQHMEYRGEEHVDHQVSVRARVCVCVIVCE
jgi:hypothetical protein